MGMGNSPRGKDGGNWPQIFRERFGILENWLGMRLSTGMVKVEKNGPHIWLIINKIIQIERKA